MVSPAFASVHSPRITLVNPRYHVVIDHDTAGKVADVQLLATIDHLRKALGPANVQIEAVCSGEGLRMLFAQSKLRSSVLREMKLGVRFAACENTMKALHIGQSQLIPGSMPVPAGVAELVKLESQGWQYLQR